MPKKPKVYCLCDTRQVVGNCMLFWKKGGGYTCNLEDADEFTYKEAMVQHRDRKSDLPYSKEILEGIAHRHVDIQDLKKIEELHQ